MSDHNFRKGLVPAIARIAALAVAIGAGFAARAETYVWAKAATGNWSDGTKWTDSSSQTGNVPGEGDTAKVDNDGAVITLTDDVTVLNFAGNSGRTVHLGGHTLTTTGTGNGMQLSEYDGASKGDRAAKNLVLTGRGVTYHNGTVVSPGALWLGINQNAYNAGFVDLDAVDYTGYIYPVRCGRVMVRNGSVLRQTEALGFGPSEYARYSFLCVTGETSRVEMPDSKLSFSGPYNGLYVFDGAKVTCNAFILGDNSCSVEPFAHIENGELTVLGYMYLGNDYGTTHNGHGSTLELVGTDAYLSVTNGSNKLWVYENEGNVFSFSIGAAGYSHDAPLYVNDIRTVAHKEGRTDFGLTTNKVACYGWCAAHPLETLTLIESKTAATDVLQGLADRTVFTDWPQPLVESGRVPTMSVSSDGKKLQLTAPEGQPLPLFTVRAEKGDVEGQKKIVISLSGLGDMATSGDIDFVWSRTAEMTETVTTNFATAYAPASMPCDLVYAFVLNEQHVPIWAKVVIRNNLGKSNEVALSFETDGFVENLVWAGADGASYNTAANWTVGTTAGGAVAAQEPRAEDTIRFVAGSYTVSFAADAEAWTMSYIGNNRQCVVFDLSGHAFTLTRPSSDSTLFASGASAPNRDFEKPARAFEFRDGTFTSTPHIHSGNTGSDAASGWWLCDGATGNFDFHAMSGSTRVMVAGGSTWNVSLSHRLEVDESNANAGHYAFLCITGENSRVVAAASFVTGGTESDFYVLEGGKYVGTTFKVGGTNRSTNDCAWVRNGTVELSGTFQVGSDDTTTARCSPGWAAGHGAKLTVSGPRALVTAGTFKVCEKADCELVFEVPAAGYAATPIQADVLELGARPAGQPEDFGETVVTISAKAWMRAHAGESAELIRIETPNAAALETLGSRVVFADVAHAPSGFRYVTVNDDGTALVLHAPPRTGVAVVIR